VQLIQQGKFDRALAAFEKLLPAAPPELLERCKMYISTCKRQMERHSLTFLTPEENYDYAISQLNTGYYEKRAISSIASWKPIQRPTTLFMGWRCWTPSRGALKTASVTWAKPSN